MNQKDLPVSKEKAGLCPVSSARRLTRLMLFFTYALYAINALGIASIFVTVTADVLLEETVLPILLDFLMDLIQILVIPVGAWGVILFAYFRNESASVMRRLFGLYIGSLFFCRICNMAAALTFNGSLYLVEDIIYAAWYLLLDLSFALVLFFVIRNAVMSFRRKKEADPFPIQKIYDKKNPLLRTTLILGIIFSSIQVLQRILYDVVYCLDAESLPPLSDVPIMILYYLYDILIGVAFYFLVRLLCRILFAKAKRDEEEEAEAEEAPQ